MRQQGGRAGLGDIFRNPVYSRTVLRRGRGGEGGGEEGSRANLLSVNEFGPVTAFNAGALPPRADTLSLPRPPMPSVLPISRLSLPLVACPLDRLRCILTSGLEKELQGLTLISRGIPGVVKFSLQELKNRSFTQKTPKARYRGFLGSHLL